MHCVMLTSFAHWVRESAMTELSVKSVSSRLDLRKRFLKAAYGWLSRRAGCRLLQAMQESRARTAAKLFREYAHLIAEGGNDSEDRSAPRQ
jgi:hypothetical protein